MKFKKFVATKTGKSLVVDAIANKKDITFKKIVVGSGSWENEELEDATNLKNTMQESLIGWMEIIDENTIKCYATIPNTGIEQEYNITEIGVIVEIDGEECLYAIATADEPVIMPLPENVGFYQIHINFYQKITSTSASQIIVSDDASVSVGIFLIWKKNVEDLMADTVTMEDIDEICVLEE